MNTLKILNWNAAGGKFLNDAKACRTAYANSFNKHLAALIRQHKPDFILLQEVARWGKGSRLTDLVGRQEGYGCHVSIAIDTVRQTHPARWQKVRSNGKWPAQVYLGQGYAILWRKGMVHCPIWTLSKPSELARKRRASLDEPKLHVEEIFMATGLYTGDRDTEPRLAIVAHFIVGDDKRPRDVFVVNLHLTTLRGEREGFPDRDDLGSQIRLGQIDVVLRGIVSRYNAWWQKQDVKRLPPVGSSPATSTAHQSRQRL